MPQDKQLAEALVGHLASIKSYDLPEACTRLGLAPGTGDESFSSKRLYVTKRIAHLDTPGLEELAVQALAARPSFFLEEALNVSRQRGRPRLTEISRRRILDLFTLEGYLSGSLELTEFLGRVWPLDSMPSTDPRFNSALGDIYQHMVSNNDWSWDYLFSYLQLLHCSDNLFGRLLETVVHPVVRDGQDQSDAVGKLNALIEVDGFHLVPADQISGRTVYAFLPKTAGVGGKPKNLIFAADGPKPEIVLKDAVNNDISIVKNADKCLIFDQPIPASGLTWLTLIDWWIERNGASDRSGAEKDLYRRLLKSLGSHPERVLFDRYFRVFRPILRERLPALIPQVYLHFDPLTARQRGAPGPLVRQRMDFLLLLSSTDRVVIEVDGKQHYADGEIASPARYSSLVAADRELRLSGYEVFRFGATELQPDSPLSVDSFFRRLFVRKSIM